MIRALQVFVRGFETHQSGGKIVEVLQDFGFTVSDCFDGTADSRGGLIETAICYEDHLEGDLNALHEAVFAIAPPGTFIQHRKFRLRSEGEVHAPAVKVFEGQEEAGM
jgi:hypothetical protein